jgi:heme-degrading monooxygenase HmoA
LCEVRGGTTRSEPGVNSSLAASHPETQRSQDLEALVLAQVDAVRGCPLGSLDLRPRREVVVVRVFRARVHPGKEDEFERFVIETGVPMVKAQEGCTHVTVGKSRWSKQPEFVVVTHWRSVDALQAFAGPDWQKAVIEPEEEHMLAQVFCDHYETIETG